MISRHVIAAKYDGDCAVEALLVAMHNVRYLGVNEPQRYFAGGVFHVHSDFASIAQSLVHDSESSRSAALMYLYMVRFSVVGLGR